MSGSTRTAALRVASQTFGAYGSGNFNATMKNENASFNWPASFGPYRDCANRDQFSWGRSGSRRAGATPMCGSEVQLWSHPTARCAARPTSSPAITSDFDVGDLDAALARVPTDVSTVHGLDLPLDWSLLTPVEEMEVVKARNTLVERCLANHGITFTFPSVDPVREAAKPRRHGLVDAGEAAAYGYRDPAVFAPRGASAEAAAQQPPPNVVSVITGMRDGKVGGRDVPAGGCAGEADRTLAADAKPASSR